MKYILLILALSLSAVVHAQNAAPKTFPGQGCWGRTDRPGGPNADGLVCRDGVFRLASETNRWEEYRNIPSAKAKELMDAAKKEGGACHELPAEKIVVCYWR